MQKKRPTAQQDTWVTGDTRAWWLDIDGYCSSLPRTSPLARMISANKPYMIIVALVRVCYNPSKWCGMAGEGPTETVCHSQVTRVLKGLSNSLKY